MARYKIKTTVDITDRQSIDLIKEEGKGYIGWPGRLNQDKNQGMLLDVLPLIQHHSVVLVFAGVKDEDVLEQHKLFNEYKDIIVYLGALTKEQMAEFYQQMDIVVLPSKNEAFGLVLIESLASGVYTLVSDRFGALDYIKDDVTSIVFDPKSITDLSNKLHYAITTKTDSNFFKKLYSNNFSMDNIVKQFINISEILG